MTFTFRHPKYYAEMRKLQASSSGLSMRGDRGKPTAASLRPELQATSFKPQAPSTKLQEPRPGRPKEPSTKLQASSTKLI